MKIIIEGSRSELLIWSCACAVGSLISLLVMLNYLRII
jgi:hypothetical protein